MRARDALSGTDAHECACARTRIRAPSQSRRRGSLATELSRLRGEVEQLSSQIQEQRRELRSQLRSFAMRKASMELSLQKAKLQLGQVLQRQKEQQKKIQSSGSAEEQLRPVMIKAVSIIRKVVLKGLPFRLKERLKILDQLTRQLENKLIRPLKAGNQLWQFVDDEMRLGRENGLYTQVIPMKGKSQLVEVARIGMVMLFFKTRDNIYGSAVRKNGSWNYEVFQGDKEKKQVRALFDSLKQKIRVGFFTLPNRLPTP